MDNHVNQLSKSSISELLNDQINSVAVNQVCVNHQHPGNNIEQFNQLNHYHHEYYYHHHQPNLIDNYNRKVNELTNKSMNQNSSSSRIDQNSGSMFQSKRFNQSPPTCSSSSSSSFSTSSNYRRTRINFTLRQINSMENVFYNLTHYPDSKCLTELSSRLHLPVTKIQIWFQNRRAKFRRNSKISN